MTLSAGAGVRICVVCGEDCSLKPRTKDRRGRYFCRECYEKAVQQARAKAAQQSAATPVVKAAPKPKKKAPVARKPKAAPPADDMLTSLADLETTGSAVETAHTCPRCGANMQLKAVLCKACGYNIKTGTTVSAAPAPATPVKRKAGGIAMGGLTGKLASPGILGVLQLVACLGLFGLTYVSEVFSPIYLFVVSIYSWGVVIWTLVSAFRESIGTGFLSLCIPFYVLYYVYGKSGNPYLQGSFGVSLLASVLSFLVLYKGMPAL
ncbi:MAG: hypothetical protein KAY37_12690 [Phycisphaerae bacterium]|nr:hypothetical protein [Phycisphaerae bacterium]